TNEILGQAISNSAPILHHVVTLTNLLPDQSYFYRVRSSGAGRAATSPVSPFHTLKSAGDITFAVVADTHEATPARYRIANLLATLEVDLVLHAGDLVQRYFTSGYADTRWMSIHDRHMRHTPYFVSFGNHDFLGGTSHLPALFETFYLP